MRVPPIAYVGAVVLLVFYAMFLAWRDEHETRVKAEKQINESAAQRSQEEHARALLEHTRELRSARLQRALDAASAEPIGPKAVVRMEYGSQPCVLVTNEGTLAEFYGVFSIQGLVRGRERSELFCRWTHTDSPRTKIAKGQTYRIILAELNWDSSPFLTATWTIRTTRESGPMDIGAHYSSTATTEPICRAPDIILSGEVFAEPDLINGSQPFRVVLKAFGSALE